MERFVSYRVVFAWLRLVSDRASRNIGSAFSQVPLAVSASHKREASLRACNVNSLAVAFKFPFRTFDLPHARVEPLQVGIMLELKLAKPLRILYVAGQEKSRPVEDRVWPRDRKPVLVLNFTAAGEPPRGPAQRVVVTGVLLTETSNPTRDFVKLSATQRSRVRHASDAESARAIHQPMREPSAASRPSSASAAAACPTTSRSRASWSKAAALALVQPPVSYTHLTLPTICSV